MKIKFIDLGDNYPSSMIKLGYFPTSNLHLEVGSSYIVYGISIWKGVVHYLVIPSDLSVPYWYPADIFEIEDPRIPNDWYFRFFGDNDPSLLKIQMGYKEMILDREHSNGLIERETIALRTFYKRKYEIDEFSNSNQM